MNIADYSQNNQLQASFTTSHSRPWRRTKSQWIGTPWFWSHLKDKVSWLLCKQSLLRKWMKTLKCLWEMEHHLISRYILRSKGPMLLSIEFAWTWEGSMQVWQSMLILNRSIRDPVWFLRITEIYLHISDGIRWMIQKNALLNLSQDLEWYHQKRTSK